MGNCGYIIPLIISLLLGNKHVMIPVSWKTWIDYTSSRKGDRK